MDMDGHDSLGVILAGGQSTRMGTEKSLLSLGGQPVLARIIARFGHQVARLILNANGDPARFTPFGLEIIPDSPDFQGHGPLAGILAGLEFAQRAGFGQLATVPCDTPFLPENLVAQLSRRGNARQIRYACSANTLIAPEPLFALWPASLAAPLREFLQGGGRKVQNAIAALPHEHIFMSTVRDTENPFLNLNSPADAAKAARIITQE